MWVAEMMGYEWITIYSPRSKQSSAVMIPPPERCPPYRKRGEYIGCETVPGKDPDAVVSKSYGAPRFSTDPAAAWSLLEHILANEDICVDCGSFFVTGGSDRTTGYGDEGEHVFKSSLCRAALLRWIEQPTTGTT